MKQSNSSGSNIESLRHYLTEINDEETENESVLERIDDLIRRDRTVRESIDDEFYAVMLRKLDALQRRTVTSSGGGGSGGVYSHEMSLVLKCIKNSAGVFRERFSPAERDLCAYLVDRIAFDELSSGTNSSSYALNAHVYLFQYIFNLIQGNKEAYEANITKWSLICFSILNRPNIKQDFYDLAAMILIYGCVEKKSSSSSTTTTTPPPDLLDSIYLDKLDVASYEHVLDRLCSILADKEYDFDDLIEHEQMHFWTYKYLHFYFEHVYFDYLVQRRRPSSANLCSLLNYQVVKLDTTSVGDKVRKYLSQPSLEFMMANFSEASTELIASNSNGGNSLRKARLLANTIADLLTLQEGLLTRDQIASNVRFAQSNEAFFKSVCELFKHVHSQPPNAAAASAASAKSTREETRLGSTSIKCELVRLLGILVFENEPNQNYLVESRLMYVLSENLDVDVDNPFLREWSIVALRHVLCAHDRK